MSTGIKFDAQQAIMEHRLSYGKKGIICGLGSGITWGLQGIIFAIALTMFPFVSSAYSAMALVVAGIVAAGMHDLFAGGWVALYTVCTARRAEFIRTLKTKPGKMILLCTLFGGPFAMSCYTVSLNYVGVTYALAMQALFPAIGAVLSVVVLKEKLVPRTWAGIFCVVVGAALVSYTPPTGDAYPNFYLGIFLAFIAACGFAVDGIIATYAMDMIDPEISIAIRLMWSGIFILVLLVPVAGIIGGAGLVGWKMLAGFFSSAGALAGLLIIAAAFTGGLCWFCNYKAFNMAGAARGMALNVTYCLWSVGFAWLFQKMGLYSYSITSIAIVGAVVILVGTILVVANPKELLQLRNN